jgi:hypothetical protein
MIPMSDTLSAEDAIRALYEQLNRADVVPLGMYRRNGPGFQLIAFANIVAGCLASKNYETAALFLARSAEGLAILRSAERKRPLEELAYFDLLERYLVAAARFVPFAEVDASLSERVPVEWRRHGHGD